jgi:hypothetical protein
MTEPSPINLLRFYLHRIRYGTQTTGLLREGVDELVKMGLLIRTPAGIAIVNPDRVEEVKLLINLL